MTANGNKPTRNIGCQEAANGEELTWTLGSGILVNMGTYIRSTVRCRQMAMNIHEALGSQVSTCGKQLTRNNRKPCVIKWKITTWTAAKGFLPMQQAYMKHCEDRCRSMEKTYTKHLKVHCCYTFSKLIVIPVYFHVDCLFPWWRNVYRSIYIRYH